MELQSQTRFHTVITVGYAPFCWHVALWITLVCIHPHTPYRELCKGKKQQDTQKEGQVTAHLPLLPLPTYRNLLRSSARSVTILTEDHDETCILGHSWGKFDCCVSSTGPMWVNITDVSDYWSYFMTGKGHVWNAICGLCISKCVILTFFKANFLVIYY